MVLKNFSHLFLLTSIDFKGEKAYYKKRNSSLNLEAKLLSHSDKSSMYF